MDLNKLEYIMKLIPDLSYIDYFEKKYWQLPVNERVADNLLYYIHEPDKNSIQIQSYRCIIVSPVELTFELGSDDTTIVQLNKYSDRYVYVYIKSDEETHRNDEDKCSYDINLDEWKNYPVIIEMRF